MVQAVSGIRVAYSDFGSLWTYTLGASVVAQLAIWWYDRKNPTKLKLLRRIVKSLPMRASEKTWLETYERQRRDLARHGLIGIVVEESAPAPLDTRVGGPLIVPMGSDIPTNAQGRPLLPLVLIRLSDLPDTEGNVLPAKGWIQVLLEPTPAKDMPLPLAQGASFRILHHAEDTAFDSHPVDQVAVRDHPAWTTVEPLPALFDGGLGLAFEPVVEPAPSGHYKVDSLPAGIRTKAFDDGFDAVYFRMEDEKPRGDVFIGGQADFTQEDIRYDNRYTGFENLVRMSGGRVFSWGDAGEATVMVPEKDLRSGRLENAVFYYDCH